MAASIRLITLNIEHDRHLEEVSTFLKRAQPDVVCLQELDKVNTSQFQEVLNAQSFFVPMSQNAEGHIAGVGIFSKWPMSGQQALWYGGSQEELPLYERSTIDTRARSIRFSLAVCDVKKDGEEFRLGTTHFPVTQRGQVTDFQREYLNNLLPILEQQGDIVFTGDFNAPRGGEIFSKIAQKYMDNVPPQYKTSLDLKIHRAAKNNASELVDKMVDGIFSTPGYSVSNVEMVSGLSDHCALVADITKL